MDLQLALQRLKRFAQSWNDDDLIDEDSMLTGAELKALVASMEQVEVSPITAFRTLEIAAERIKEGPQTGQHVRDALNALRGKVERWKLNMAWEHLQRETRTDGAELVGAQQNLNAALNGIASDLRIRRLDPVELARAVRDSLPPRDAV